MCADRRPKLVDVVVGRQTASVRNLGEEPALLQWARTQKGKSDGGLVLVAPGLLLGNKMAASDTDLLHRKGVVAVCAVGARQVFPGSGHHVSIEDDGAESMLPHFEAACNFIHEHRQRGTVLVHCKGGISRSPAMVIAYLMKHEHLSLTDAMEVCSLARPAARPREMFLQDLESWEAMIIEEVKWDQAVAQATDEAVIQLGPRDPGSTKEGVQAECSRLLDALLERCTLEAFGQVREPRWQLREAAQEVVTRYADGRGWRKGVRKDNYA